MRQDDAGECLNGVKRSLEIQQEDDEGEHSARSRGVIKSSSRMVVGSTLVGHKTPPKKARGQSLGALWWVKTSLYMARDGSGGVT